MVKSAQYTRARFASGQLTSYQCSESSSQSHEYWQIADTVCGRRTVCGDQTFQLLWNKLVTLENFICKDVQLEALKIGPSVTKISSDRLNTACALVA